MAILHVRDARPSARRWLVLGGASLALGATLGSSLVRFEGSPSTPAGGPLREAAGCCGARELAPASAPPVPAGLQGTAAVAANLEASRAASAYRQALSYLDCQAQAEAASENASGEPDERYTLDPSGAFAAQLERDAQARRSRCQSVGPYEYRQIEALMREAAQRGDRDAELYLLERDLRSQVEQAAATRELGLAAPNQALAASAAALEALARGGHREAMVVWAQLLAGHALGTPDPVLAAAWKLVALQLERGKPLTEDDLGDSGLLSSLNADESQQALREAATLRLATSR